VRVQALTETTQAAERSLHDVTVQAERDRAAVHAHEATLQTAVSRLAELHEQINADKARHFEEMSRHAHLQNEAVASKAEMDNLRRERDRMRQRSDIAAESLASLDVELQELLQSETQLLERLVQARRQLQDSKLAHDQLRHQADQNAARVSELRQDRSGLA